MITQSQNAALKPDNISATYFSSYVACSSTIQTQSQHPFTDPMRPQLDQHLKHMFVQQLPRNSGSEGQLTKSGNSLTVLCIQRATLADARSVNRNNILAQLLQA